MLVRLVVQEPARRPAVGLALEVAQRAVVVRVEQARVRAEVAGHRIDRVIEDPHGVKVLTGGVGGSCLPQEQEAAVAARR